MKEQSEGRWFVGIDWASEKHDVCALDADGQLLGERTVAHSGTGLAQLCDWLLELSAGDTAAVRVAIEIPHGAVVETLQERQLPVYALNPKQLDRFRDRFTLAGAKDDRRDARVLADSLRTDMHCFRRLESAPAEVIELREWSRMTDDLQHERVRLGNRLRQQLRRDYPELLELTDDVATGWFVALWELIPSPARAARVRGATIAKLLAKHRVRRLDAAAVRQVLSQKSVTVAAGTTEAATAHITVLVARLRLVNQQLKQANKTLDRLTAALGRTERNSADDDQEHERRDAEILSSLPGVGRVVLATLLAEASQPLGARDYHVLRSLTGVAPVTRRSGKSSRVVMRRACHPRLRHAAYHWARTATQHDPTSRAKYAALRGRGHSHGRALRSVADRLLAVACAMLERRELFEPGRGRTAQQD